LSTVIITLPSVPTVVTCLAAASTVHAWVALLSSMGTLGVHWGSCRFLYEKRVVYIQDIIIYLVLDHVVYFNHACETCIELRSIIITNGRLSTATIRSSSVIRAQCLCTDHAMDHGCSRPRTGLRVKRPVRSGIVAVRVQLPYRGIIDRRSPTIAGAPLGRATARGRRCPAPPPSPHTRSRLPNIRLFLYNVAFRAPCEQLQRARRRLLQEALGQACPGAESVRQTAPPCRKETSAI
jgi:hypothetical protein